MAKIGIVGTGTWGTALGIHLSNNGHEVELWSKFPDEIESLSKNHTHINLPEAVIPDGVAFTTDLKKVCMDKDIIVMAVPSIFTRQTACQMKPYIRVNQIVVCVAKGIEEDTLKTQTDIIEEELPMAEATVLSGPSHAEEVSRGIPTAVVVGARNKKTAEYIQNVFMSTRFRVYISPDILGIEVGGALKNVIALSAGMVDGLGYGDNSLAALITRGITEMGRLGTAMGCDLITFYGLTGLGDLIVTCQSKHSRNRRAGVLIGKGYNYEQAMEEVKMVVEGVYSAKAGKQLAMKYNVEMPIVEEVNQILFNNKAPKDAVNDLLCRDKTVEHPMLSWDK
ncbi:MAG: NAD(P)H-dependent glycerol-3-phosphate dehydrogenase [Eubacteriales bacterium]|nr:NAD(P)H-dependent glycerol-3-phosphate dehydrogenase [Eubacteriales bacterium]